MRILHLGINYWPDETGIAPYNTLRCEDLAARGHEVTALTGFPYYPQWRIPAEYRHRIYVREQRNGVAIVRSWMYVPQRVTSLKRVIHEASFCASVLMGAVTQKHPDIIVAVSPPLPLTISARILSRRWGVPYVLHVEDLQPDAAVDLGMLRSGRVTDALYAVERAAYRRAAYVTTLNDAMVSRIRSKSVAAEKTGVLQHGVDPDLFEVRTTADGARFREIHGLKGQFLVVHAGNMGVKQGLDVILEAAARSREISEITYLLVGDGANRHALERRAEAERLSNVRFLPELPRSGFHDLLATAEISLVSQQRVVADILFPSKVETLMAVGQPIVASVGAASTVAEVLRKSGAGDLVIPEDPDALLDAILALKRAPLRRALMALRGQSYAREHWSRRHTLDAMESMLLRICSEHAGGDSDRTVRAESPDSARAVRRQDSGNALQRGAPTEKGIALFGGKDAGVIRP